MTGNEVSEKALKMYNERNNYAYLYGAKGEFGNEENITRIIKTWNSYFKKYSKEEIEKIKNFCLGKTLFDCSGFICKILGAPDYNSATIIAKCNGTKVSDWGLDGKGTPGTIFWKSGHIGINRGDGTFLHMPTELHTIDVGKVSEYDWNVCGKWPNVEYSSNSCEIDYKKFYEEMSEIFYKYKED